LKHRGPDDAGFVSGPAWGLGFRRLSILDVSALGHQPMSTACGRYWIVFNGEIYNYIELREGLAARGEQFTTGSDTEVLLRMLTLHGSSALPLLNGMFAFVLVDTAQRTFLMARDRLGVKPLYYSTRPGQVLFASELKGLLAASGAGHEADRSAVAEYLAYGYLSGGTCIFKGYHKVAPGSFLAGSLDRPEDATAASFWRLDLNPDWGGESLSSGQTETLQALLTDAVRIRLRSDVPVGVFLSSGIDSGLVTVLAAAANRGSPPLALTVGFDEPEFDETSLASSVARLAGLKHQVVQLPQARLSMIDRLAWHFDEPFDDPSALPTFILCQAASQSGKVFLAGDGGDEAFGGYRRHVHAHRNSWLAWATPTMSRVLRRAGGLFSAESTARYRLHKAGLSDSGFAAAYDGSPDDPILSTVLHTSLLSESAAVGRLLWDRWGLTHGQSLIARQQALDYHDYLPNDILVKIDRSSMAASIEVRSPFLDYRLVEWAARLPRGVLLNRRQGKLPLRRLSGRLLPPEVAAADKRGFRVPLDVWFREDSGQAFLRERLLSPEALSREWWNPTGVSNVIAAQKRGGGRDFGPLLWRLLFLDSWARLYHDGRAFMNGLPAM